MRLSARQSIAREARIFAMMIETTRFGTLSIDESRVITLPEGLPGFESCRQFTVVPHPGGDDGKDGPFEWLQSIEDASLAFLAMDPHHVFPQYNPHLSAGELQSLGIEGIGRDSARVYALLTVPKGDPCGITANLMAPLVVNCRTLLGKQIVACNENYGLRHRLLPN